jgi:hypothetical protein
MALQITQKLMKSYEINNNGEWATVALEIGDKSAQVIAHTSYGEYAYTWTATGDNPIGFLKRISFDYAMTKFKGRYEVYDRDAQSIYLENEVKEYAQRENIEDDLKEDYLAQAEEVSGSAINTTEFMMLLERSDLLEVIFEGDYSCVDIKTKPDPQCVGFWEEIWKPLMESLTSSPP